MVIEPPIGSERIFAGSDGNDGFAVSPIRDSADFFLSYSESVKRARHRVVDDDGKVCSPQGPSARPPQKSEAEAARGAPYAQSFRHLGKDILLPVHEPRPTQPRNGG